MNLLQAKKGIFLTFIAVLIVTLLLLYASMKYEVSYKDTVPTDILRITGIDNFITDFEEVYLQRALFAAGHRALDAVINATPDEGKRGDTRVDDIQGAFKEAMLNASINHGAVFLPSMVNNTLPLWLNRLSGFAQQTLHLNVTYTILDVNITQDETTGPWLVNVTMVLDYAINATGITWERKNLTIITAFDIFGFEDPYLRYKTDNQVRRPINRFNITGKNYNAENLTSLIVSATFIHEKKAPKFLDRFGRVKPDSGSGCCGIFSLVSSSQATGVFLPSSDKNYADFTYLENFCFDKDLFSIKGVSAMVDVGSFYLDGYFIDKVFGFPANESDQVNDPEKDPCGA